MVTSSWQPLSAISPNVRRVGIRPLSRITPVRTAKSNSQVVATGGTCARHASLLSRTLTGPIATPESPRLSGVSALRARMACIQRFGYMVGVRVLLGSAYGAPTVIHRTCVRLRTSRQHSLNCSIQVWRLLAAGTGLGYEPVNSSRHYPPIATPESPGYSRPGTRSSLASGGPSFSGLSSHNPARASPRNRPRTFG